jgi:hypothetical protein
MPTLSEFVSEHRSKSANSKIFNVANIGANVSSAFKGYLRTDANADDSENLMGQTPGTSGTLPAGRNR